MQTIRFDGQSLIFEQIQAVEYGKLNAPKPVIAFDLLTVHV